MRLITGVLILLPALVAAETAYVTDNLRLGLHAAEDTSDRAFRFLESGQAMEVLSRNRNYANVRLPDGTEGWVKSAYLVEEKPAKLIVAEAMDERDRISSELEEAKAAFAEPAATIEDLRNQAAQLQLQSYLSKSYGDARAKAVLGAVSFSQNNLRQVVGFLAGLRWVDHRSRKRHGGIRVY